MKIIKWSYIIRVLTEKMSHAEFRNKLNDMGQKGYEFVTTVRISDSEQTILIFKIPCGYIE